MMEENIWIRAEITGKTEDLLKVTDLDSGMRIDVHLMAECSACVGDRVDIRYNGAMTRSLPPQIAALQVRKL